MNTRNLSKYQKQIVDMLKSGGYIIHSEGSLLNAIYVNGNKETSVRFQTVEILYNIGILKHIDDKSFKLVLS